MNTLQLSFVPGDPASYLAALTAQAPAGTPRVLLQPWGDLARAVVGLAASEGRDLRFFATAPEPEARAAGVSAADASFTPDAIFLFDQEPADLSGRLLEFLDLQSGHIVAPRTGHHFESRPLFLISIPKSGTHLLYELAEAFGYQAGIVCPEQPLGGHWYCVEYSNSHTVARDFFVDTVRRSPFGNRHHPFPRCPALFIYRNPLDIVVSEANYYHRDGATAFAGYLADQPFAERLLRLINDPWLLGSIRDRVAGFAPWLDFPNVVPVSFEELIGPNGGGNVAVQTRLIWSLQLKLHVPGNPVTFGDRVFNRESATFHAGRIGAHAEAFTDAARRAFEALPQDFMAVFGYREAPAEAPRWRPLGALARALSGRTSRRSTPVYSLRAGEFRRRPLHVSTVDFDATPIAVQSNVLHHNIVRYRGHYFAVPHSAGPLDLRETLAEMPGAFAAHTDLDAARQDILAAGQAPPRLLKALPDCNIVYFRRAYFVIPLACGPIDLQADGALPAPGIFSTATLAEALDLATAPPSTPPQE